MLVIEKNNEIKQKLTIALQRLQRLKSVKNLFFDYLIKTNSLQKVYAKKIWNSITDFEQKIVKITFYSSDKVKLILNFTKIYRQFAINWQKITKVNIKNLEKNLQLGFQVSEKLVQQKAKVFFQQLKKYQSQQKSYNKNYVTYEKMCNNLNQDIQKFKSYSDPLCFYNEKVTSQFLQNLTKKYEKCNVQQTHLKTQTQLLDQKRHYLGQSLGQVKQAFVPTFQKFLKHILTGFKYIVDPSKDEAIQKQDFKLRRTQQQQNKYYSGQIQNLLNSQNKQAGIQDENQNIIKDFKQLFKSNQLSTPEITSDQKFFHDRCQNIKNKKVKRSNQIMNIQKLLIKQLHTQMENLKQFQVQIKKNQKDIFSPDGIQSYKKKFKKYFGKNFHSLYQLCLTISQTRRHSIQKIYKVMQSWYEKLSHAFNCKKQSLRFFQSRTKVILQDHKKIKQKVQTIHIVSNNIIQEYKNNVQISYAQFSKIYKDLQQNQVEMDKVFFKSLKQISDVILKQAINKSLGKIIEKEKNRMQILKKINLINEAQSNFYEDSKYQIFFSEQMTPNLNKKFKSVINKKQFQETRKTLYQKQETLKGMIKHKITCCGIKSKPFTANIKQSYDCYLINFNQNRTKVRGILNILSNGINFCQKSVNPFSNLIQIIVPNKQIQNYKQQVLNQIQVLTVLTKKGSVYFMGTQIPAILSTMLKQLGLKPVQKQASDKNVRNVSSTSSILGGSISQSFRVQFDKSTSSSLNRIQSKNSPLKKRISKGPSQFVSNDQMLNKVNKSLINENFFSLNFIIKAKQLPIKDNSRFNYQFQKDHHKFLLKQKKQSHLQGNKLSFDYSWKVSFPQNTMLKSFKHYQTVYIELLKNLVKIQIFHGINLKNVSLAQKIFYEEISDMNNRLTAFIVNLTQRQGQINIKADQQSEMASELCVDPEQIVINLQRQNKQFSTTNNKFDKMSQNGQSILRNSRMQRSMSSFTNRVKN